MRHTIVSLVLLTIMVACNKVDLEVNKYWQCHQSQNPDTTTIAQKLAGTWKWTHQMCFWVGKTIKADKNIELSFLPNRNFFVLDNGTVLTQGTWSFKVVDGTSWGLDLSTRSDYLLGRILLCGNEVLFNHSYIDGCDNLFKKTN